MNIIPGVSLHARERAAQRLGRDPSRDQWLAAVASILNRTALLLRRAPGDDGRERWRVRLGPFDLDVWWDAPGAQIVTVLEPGSPTLDPRKQQIRNAQARHRSRPEPYRRERHRAAEDWQ